MIKYRPVIGPFRPRVLKLELSLVDLMYLKIRYIYYINQKYVPMYLDLGTI